MLQSKTCALGLAVILQQQRPCTSQALLQLQQTRSNTASSSSSTHLAVENDFSPIGVKDAPRASCIARQLVKGVQGGRDAGVPQRSPPQHQLPCSTPI
jgi:hypothetical protein